MMTQNSPSVDVPELRRPKLEFTRNCLIFNLILLLAGPLSQAGIVEDQNIIDRHYPQPQPQASAGDYQAYLEKMKENRDSLQVKVKKSDLEVIRLRKKLNEKKADLEKVKEKLVVISAEHQKFAQQKSDIDLNMGWAIQSGGTGFAGYMPPACANLGGLHAASVRICSDAKELGERRRTALEVEKQLTVETTDLEKYLQRALVRAEEDKNHFRIVGEVLSRPLPPAPVAAPIKATSEPIVIAVRSTEDELADALKAALAARKNSVSSLDSTTTTTTSSRRSSMGVPAPNKYRGKNALKAFEAGFAGDDINTKHEAIVEMSHLHGPDLTLIGLVYEKAFLSKDRHIQEAAEALLADFPEPGRTSIKGYLMNSPHEEVRLQARNATPYSEMIQWIKELPKYLDISAPTCNNCALNSASRVGK